MVESCIGESCHQRESDMIAEGNIDDENIADQMLEDVERNGIQDDMKLDDNEEDIRRPNRNSYFFFLQIFMLIIVITVIFCYNLVNFTTPEKSFSVANVCDFVYFLFFS